LPLEGQLLYRVPWPMMQHSLYQFLSLQRLMIPLEQVYNRTRAEPKFQLQGEQMTQVWSQKIDPKHRCLYETSLGLSLEEGGGNGNEKGGGGPKKSAEGNDMGTVVTHREVSGEWVARGLHHGSEKSE